MKGRWAPHDARDEIVDYVRRWSGRTELPAKRLVGWIGIGTSKLHNWKDRYGKPSQKGKGFTQPLRPHQHWHIDISHLNLLGTFYSLSSIIDGYSRDQRFASVPASTGKSAKG